MKKFISMVLAATCLISMSACSSSSSDTSSSTSTSTTTSTESSASSTTTTEASSSTTTTEAETAQATSTSSGKFANGLIVGSTTDINADIFNPYWSNGAQNKSLYVLISGYGTHEKTPDGTFTLNTTVVKDLQITENPDGGKTYTYTIHDNLVWNDSTPITALDYVFKELLTSSPEFGSLDNATNTYGAPYVGYDAFVAGDTKTFEGINLIDEYTFSITGKPEEFPNYYESYNMSGSPLPMHAIAPGVEITDDGSGATFSDEFTAALLQETILNTSTGYRYNPQVTCGPYNFVSFDNASLQAVLEINPLYLGGYDGAIPTIERVVFKSVVDATMMDELAAGTVHLISGVNGGEKIDMGLNLVDDGIAGYTSYPRSGYGKLEFACEFGPTQFEEVRQAIAYSLDRVEFAETWTGGYGQLTHSLYGLSQWEAQASMEFLETELNHYTKNLEVAEQVLIDGGWTLNATGGDFVKGTDDIRHKEVDGELMPLVIEWASSQDNPISDMLVIRVPEEVAKIGMKVNQTVMDFGTLLNHLYRTSEELAVYHMFNLASSFADINSYWYYFSQSPEYLGLYNTERIMDDELESIGNAMKNVPSDDPEQWLSLWQDMVLRYNELVVNLPLYSDEYHEFFTPELVNYYPYGLWSWENALIRANLAE